MCYPNYFGGVFPLFFQIKKMKIKPVLKVPTQTIQELRLEREFKSRYVEENIHKLAQMNGETFEEKIKHIKEDRPDYRIEEIKGHKCIVIPSKI